MKSIKVMWRWVQDQTPGVVEEVIEGADKWQERGHYTVFYRSSSVDSEIIKAINTELVISFTPVGEKK